MQSLIIPLLCIGIVALLLVINYRAVTRQERRNPLPPAEIDWHAIDDPIVQAEIAKNSKIGAIKRYRELTGLGLKESKDAIDYAILHPDDRGDKKKQAAYDAHDAGIRDLIRDGRLTEAVEIYRKFAGVDPYTARDAVARIERELRQNPPPESHTALLDETPDHKASRN